MTSTDSNMPHVSKLIPNACETHRPILNTLTALNDSPSSLVGQVVVIHSRGCWRTARVVKVGRKNVVVAYTTQSAINNAFHPDMVAWAARRGRPVPTPNVTRKSVPLSEVYDTVRRDNVDVKQDAAPTAPPPTVRPELGNLFGVMPGDYVSMTNRLYHEIQFKVTRVNDKSVWLVYRIRNSDPSSFVWADRGARSSWGTFNGYTRKMREFHVARGGKVILSFSDGVRNNIWRP